MRLNRYQVLGLLIPDNSHLTPNLVKICVILWLQKELKTASTCYDNIVETTPQPFALVQDTTF